MDGLMPLGRSSQLMTLLSTVPLNVNTWTCAHHGVPFCQCATLFMLLSANSRHVTASPVLVMGFLHPLQSEGLTQSNVFDVSSFCVVVLATARFTLFFACVSVGYSRPLLRGPGFVQRAGCET